MENDPARAQAHKDALLEILLITLTEELEGAIAIVSHVDITKRFGELMTHCINATAMARAGQRLVSRFGEAELAE